MAEDIRDALVQETSIGGRRVRKITPEDTPTIYANNVGLRTTLWDMTLDFGMILTADTDNVIIRDVASVVMSPQHAKAFANVLAENVRRYEEQHGPLPRIPDRDEQKPPEEDGS